MKKMNIYNFRIKSRGLEVYGIKTLNSDYQKLHDYKKNTTLTTYSTLFNGKSLARKYGARAAPTFVLIDRNGKIIYLKHGFHKDEIKIY